jgi:hypothetical protein
MFYFFRNLYYRFLGRPIQRLEDIYSYAMIKEFSPKTFFPITGSSLGFHAMATIINDIKINNRSSVIEFGAGLSTIMLAKYAHKYKKDLRIYSVEHDSNYLLIVRNILITEGVSDYVIFVKARIEDILINNVKYQWYSFLESDSTVYNQTFDLVIIDGPIVNRMNEGSLVRYPAIEFVKPKLQATYSIYLDDVHRRSEQKLMEKAQNEHNIKFRKISQTLAVATGGLYYNAIP